LDDPFASWETFDDLFGASPSSAPAPVTSPFAKPSQPQPQPQQPPPPQPPRASVAAAAAEASALVPVDFDDFHIDFDDVRPPAHTSDKVAFDRTFVGGSRRQ
jgi:hypothetical protein